MEITMMWKLAGVALAAAAIATAPIVGAAPGTNDNNTPNPNFAHAGSAPMGCATLVQNALEPNRTNKCHRTRDRNASTQTVSLLRNLRPPSSVRGEGVLL